ncbi:MAG: TonB family protein [Proteobacteria bacterium]|nr:TonB family protein [Pseudomonadota bacterium]
MFARYASAVTSGSLVTVALLYAMQGLTGLAPGAAEAPRNPHFVDWVRLPPDEEPAQPHERPFDRERLTDVPEPPAGGPRSSGDIGLSIPARPGDPGPVPTGPGTIGRPDAPLITVVRVQPAYPAVARRRGLEGWVDVRFDVMTSGLVANVEVVRSSHRVFEGAALRAAQRFRFKAPVAGGVPQVASGVEYRFRFEMEN